MQEEGARGRRKRKMQEEDARGRCKRKEPGQSPHPVVWHPLQRPDDPTEEHVREVK